MERNGAPVRGARPGEQSSALSAMLRALRVDLLAIKGVRLLESPLAPIVFQRL